MKKVLYFLIIGFIFGSCQMSSNSFSKQKYTNLKSKKTKSHSENRTESVSEEMVSFEEVVLGVDESLEVIPENDELIITAEIIDKNEETEEEKSRDRVVFKERIDGFVEKLTAPFIIPEDKKATDEKDQGDVVDSVSDSERNGPSTLEGGEVTFFHLAWASVFFFVLSVVAWVVAIGLFISPVFIVATATVVISWVLSILALRKRKSAAIDDQMVMYSLLSFLMIMNIVGAILIIGAFLLIFIAFLFY